MLKVALIQLLVTSNKAENLLNACKKIKLAAEGGAKLVCLPECFNSPYGVKFFQEYSETIPTGITCQKLSEAAKENKIWLVGGSIPECLNGKLYNTSTVYNPDGELVGKYSKIHLFDINVPGKIVFKESDILTAGNRPFSFDIPLNENRSLKVGIGICYDIRFSELAQIYSREHQCKLLLYPGAFNMTTGPLHWELMGRMVAAQNQCYVGLCSPAQNTSAEYIAYGHTLAADPWAAVIRTLKEQEDVLEFEVNLDEVDIARAAIPITAQRREDVYSIAKQLVS